MIRAGVAVVAGFGVAVTFPQQPENLIRQLVPKTASKTDTWSSVNDPVTLH